MPTNSDAPNSSHRKRNRNDAEELQTPPCAQCRTRKVRCDRQQPECSNCRKAGVPCDYSNSPSRVYHVKELLDAFSSVTSRLDRIEASLAGLADQIKLLAPNTTPESLSSSTTVGRSQKPVAQVEQSPSPAAPAYVDPEQSNEVVQEYPAALSLFKSLHRRLASTLNGQPQEPKDLWTLAAHNPTLRTILKGQLEAFPFLGECLEFPITGDNQPICSPPPAVLEICFENYLNHINVHTPIFDKSDLEKVLDSHDELGQCQQSPGQALSFNNIVLLSMTLDAHVVRSTDSTTQALDLVLARSLLDNCDRAVSRLDQFSTPSLDNLKALLTLVLVCQEYYSSVVFSQVCQTTFRLVRTMGLHQASSPGQKTGSWKDISEQERLFWTAYSLCKRFVFLNGQPGSLYLFNSNLPLYPCNEKKHTPQLFHGAFNHLFTIWEEIYLALYSLRSRTTGPAHRSQQIDRLRGVLCRWKQTHQHLLDADLPEQSSHLTLTHLELQYAFHVSQILVQRCDSTASPQQRYRDLSRAALDVLNLIPQGCISPHTSVTLARIFRNYPMVAFHDLFVYILAGDKTELPENSERLYETRRYLEPFRNPDFPESYYNKLYAGFTWYTDQLGILQYVLKDTPAGGRCPDLDEQGGTTLTGFNAAPTSTPLLNALENPCFPPSESFFDVGPGSLILPWDAGGAAG